MSPLARAGGSHHHVRRIVRDIYEISWSYEVKHGRILGHRTLRRDTDRRGAERFARRWGCSMPGDPTVTGHK